MTEPWKTDPIIAQTETPAEPAPWEADPIVEENAVPWESDPITEEDDGSFFGDLADFVAEVPQAIASGVVRAAQGTADFAAESVRSMAFFPEDFPFQNPIQAPTLPAPDRPETAGGQMVEGITQFVTGMVGPYKGLGGLAKAGKVGKYLRGVAAGSASDLLVWDPHEERLSNLIQQFPILQNPVTEYLAAQPGDSDAEGRLKGVLEGGVAGGLLDGLVWGLKGIRGARKAKAAKGLEAASAENIAEAGTRLRKPAAEDVAAGKTPELDAPPQEPQPLTPEDLLTQLDPDLQVRAAGRTSLFPTREVRVAGNINLDRIDSPEAFKNALDVVARSEAGFEAARATGREAGEAATRAQRQLLEDSTTTLMADTVKAVGGSDADKLRFYARLAQHAGIQAQAAGKAAEASARLRTYKEISTLSSDNIQEMRDALEQVGGGDLVELKAALLSKLDDLDQFTRAAPKMFEPTKMDKFLEVWRAGLLTGFRTHDANLLSNSAVLAYAVPERVASAAWGALSGDADRVLFRESGAFASGAFKAMRRASGDAWEVFWRGENDLPDFVEKNVPFLRGGEVKVGPSKIDARHKAAIKGGKGFALRSVYRALDASDTWFKTVNFAGEAEALALRQAVKEGYKDQELAARVSNILAAMPDDIVEAANKRANANTFTTPLHEQEGFISDFAQSLTKFAGKHPTASIAVPFIRTPANILKFALERTPLGFMTADMKKAFKAGGAARQEVMGKVTLGSSFMGTVAAATYAGNVTGHGPVDPNERRMWLIDHQPYSWKVPGTDEWKSYSRLEPLGTLMGIAADSVEIGKTIRRDEYEELVMLGVMATANTFVSKSFMQGPAAVIKAIDDPRRHGGRFAQMLAGSLIPTVVSDVTKAIDPVLRNVRSLHDTMLSRTPGASKTLAPMPNIWGDKITREGGVFGMMFSPVYTKTDSDDKVAKEILRLGIAPGMPGRQINGIDLDPHQWFEFVKLAGRGDGKKFMGAKPILDRLVSDPKWNKLPDFSKAKLIDRVITTNRDSARTLMKARYPDQLIMQPAQQRVESMEEAKKETTAITPEQGVLVAAQVGLGKVFGTGATAKPATPEQVENRVAAAGARLFSSELSQGGTTTVDPNLVMRVAADPDGLMASLFTASDDLAESSPVAFSAQVEAAQRAASYLTANAPRRSSNPSLDGESPELPSYEQDAWARAVQGVVEPMVVIDDLSKGIINKEGLGAIREVYPALYDRLAFNATRAMITSTEKPDYEQRLMLGSVLGPAVEPTLRPRFVSSMQAVFAGAESAGGEGPNMPGQQRLTLRQQRNKSRNISVAMAENMGEADSLQTPIQQTAEPV